MSDASIQIDEICKRCSRTLKIAGVDKIKMLQQIGSHIKNYDLYGEIGASGIYHANHVRDWQHVHLGTQGGYVAVRAKGSAEGGGVGADSYGAITNYLENGTLKGKRIKPHSFYEQTRSAAPLIAKAEAEDFAERLAANLRGE